MFFKFNQSQNKNLQLAMSAVRPISLFFFFQFLPKFPMLLNGTYVMTLKQNKKRRKNNNGKNTKADT